MPYQNKGIFPALPMSPPKRDRRTRGRQRRRRGVFEFKREGKQRAREAQPGPGRMRPLRPVIRIVTWCYCFLECGHSQYVILYPDIVVSYTNYSNNTTRVAMMRAHRFMRCIRRYDIPSSLAWNAGRNSSRLTREQCTRMLMINCNSPCNACRSTLSKCAGWNCRN